MKQLQATSRCYLLPYLLAARRRDATKVQTLMVTMTTVTMTTRRPPSTAASRMSIWTRGEYSIGVTLGQQLGPSTLGWADTWAVILGAWETYRAVSTGVVTTWVFTGTKGTPGVIISEGTSAPSLTRYRYDTWGCHHQRCWSLRTSSGLGPEDLVSFNTSSWAAGRHVTDRLTTGVASSA